ncbi:flagellar biogenesis protein FliO [Mucilaginibacter sp. OAE612]
MPGTGSLIIEIMISKIKFLIIIGFVAAGIWLVARHRSAQNVKPGFVQRAF